MPSALGIVARKRVSTGTAALLVVLGLVPGAASAATLAAPLVAPPRLNVASAGAEVSVAFDAKSADAAKVLGRTAPVSYRSSCTGGGRLKDNPVKAPTLGAATVDHAAGSTRYVYRWKTRQTWGGKCRRLEIKLADGTSLVALFRFDRFRFFTGTSRALNTARAPSTLPVHFTLEAPASPLLRSPPESQPIDCTTRAPTGPATPAQGDGPAKLPGITFYTYAWKIPAAFAGTCRRLLLRLTPFSTSVQVASYRFTAAPPVPDTPDTPEIPETPAPPANRAPVATPDSGAGFGTDEDTPVTTASLLANDSDPDGDVLTVQSLETGATTGTATKRSDGTVDYVPNGKFEGLDGGQSATDTFGYTISDGNGHTATSTATVLVSGVNDAPVVASATTLLPENSPAGTAVTTTAFTDAESGQSHAFSITGGNAAGAFAINPATGAITVANATPLDFETTPSFALAVRVTDGGSPAKQGNATVTVNLSDVPEVAPSAATGTAGVAEAALGTATGALVNGSNPSSTAEIATGNLTYGFGSAGPSGTTPFAWGTTVTVSDPEGADPAPGALRSGGHLVSWSVSPDGTTLTGTANAQPVVKVELTNTTTGAHKVTLLGPLDHPDANQTATDDQLRLSIPYTVKDANGVTAASTLALTVDDDGPTTQSQTAGVSPGQVDTNLMLIVDVSGSQGNPSGIVGLTRMEVQKAALEELIKRYDQAGNVAVRVITFSSTASANGSTWESAASAISFINSLSPSGSTNYDAALTAAQAAFASTGKIAGALDVSYFLSDGEPNLPSGSAGTNASEENAWRSFLSANAIRSVAVGITSDVTKTALNPVAYDGRTGTDTNGTVYTDLSLVAPPNNLAGAVDSGLQGGTTGNLLAGGASGADDPAPLRSIGLAGDKTYTYDPVTDAVTATGSGTTTHTFDASTNVLEITTAPGPTITVDFDDGSFDYVPTGLTSAASQTFTFSRRDADLDTSSSTLTLNVTVVDTPPLARPDRVITSITGSGVNIPMSDAALLFNDVDDQGDPLSLTAVSSAAGGNVAAAGGSVTFTDVGTDGGSFVYTAQSTTLADTATATVNRAQAGEATLDGTGLADVLIAGSSATTLNGNGNADFLVGGAADDTLNGGLGDDMADTASGDDAVLYTAVSDGTDTVLNFDGNAAGGQDSLVLDSLFDSLGVAAVSRAARVQIVDNGATVAVNVNADTSSPDFELHVADLVTGDAVTVGSDVIVGS